jgi:PEP-CTERM motif
MAAQAAPVTRCTAAAPDASWAECAGVESVEGGSALASSIDFATLSLHAEHALQTSIDAPQAVAAIPEPHTNLLMVAGLAAIGFMTMRRRRP